MPVAIVQMYMTLHMLPASRMPFQFSFCQTAVTTGTAGVLHKWHMVYMPSSQYMRQSVCIIATANNARRNQEASLIQTTDFALLCDYHSRNAGPYNTSHPNGCK
jgi:hypothetical protein